MTETQQESELSLPERIRKDMKLHCSCQAGSCNNLACYYALRQPELKFCRSCFENQHGRVRMFFQLEFDLIFSQERQLTAKALPLSWVLQLLGIEEIDRTGSVIKVRFGPKHPKGLRGLGDPSYTAKSLWSTLRYNSLIV